MELRGYYLAGTLPRRRASIHGYPPVYGMEGSMEVPANIPIRTLALTVNSMRFHFPFGKVLLSRQ